MEGYAKLWSSLTRSSLWQRESKDVRLLFVSMLAIADAEGYVGSSVPGLAKDANLTIEEVQAALNVLQSPDLYSRNPANDGRRIKKVHRGWTILNYREHRDGEMKRERRRHLAKERMRKIRERRKRDAARDRICDASLSPVAPSDAVLRDVTPACAVLRNCEKEPLSNKDLQTPVAQPLRETCAYAEAEAEALINTPPSAEIEDTPHARDWDGMAIIPHSLRTPAFIAAWQQRWVPYQLERFNGFHVMSQEAQLAELKKEGPEEGVRTIDRSILKGAKQICFNDRKETNGKPKSDRNRGQFEENITL